MSLSDAIKAEIERQRLTADRVAKRAGIKPDVVSRFLSGERDVETPGSRAGIDRRPAIGSGLDNLGRPPVGGPS